MRSRSDDSPSDEDGDDEDDNESELLDANAVPIDYIVPLKEPEDAEDSVRDLSENSISVNGNAQRKISDGESFTRGGKLRRLAPPPLKRRRALGTSRTPRAPSPVIPPKSTDPWPEIQDSDIRDSVDLDTSAARHPSATELNGISMETTPPPRGSFRRQEKEDPTLSAEERIKRSKRVKISPKKEKSQPNRQRSPPNPLMAALLRDEAQSGTATPRFLMNVKDKEETDPTRYNEENCGACGGPGRFLCCEGCPKSFHFTCLDPPIDENDLPEDSW
jgi:PHD-finger